MTVQRDGIVTGCQSFSFTMTCLLDYLNDSYSKLLVFDFSQFKYPTDISSRHNISRGINLSFSCSSIFSNATYFYRSNDCYSFSNQYLRFAILQYISIEDRFMSKIAQWSFIFLQLSAYSSSSGSRLQ